ncbi:RICIN domain-containing protein [Streptomyces sp. NPDC088553]|uniref:RICIN domain-containing protein n=1 Tax=Streptomyces sp. NPDC088553 TaxID=3365864 RepID=UPI003821B684
MGSVPAHAERSEVDSLHTWGFGVKCATPLGGDTTNGTILTIWDCTGSSLQKFVWQSDYRVRHVASGKCITPKGGASRQNGTVLTLWSCLSASNEDDSQYFTVGNTWAPSSPQITYTMFGSKCITNYGGNGGNGTWLTLWSCNTADWPPSQNWHMNLMR